MVCRIYRQWRVILWLKTGRWNGEGCTFNSKINAYCALDRCINRIHDLLGTHWNVVCDDGVKRWRYTLILYWPYEYAILLWNSIFVGNQASIGLLITWLSPAGISIHDEWGGRIQFTRRAEVTTLYGEKSKYRLSSVNWLFCGPATAEKNV